MVKNVVLVIQDILGVLLGYLRCSSMNPEVKEEDAMGSYGFEDDDCCGIGETYIYDKKVIVTISVWTYENEMLTLKATSKCLFDMNSQNARMTECDKSDAQTNHPIHFMIVDNKFICIKK
ncbi:hypothetical protein LY90DRAFT_500250 [Neocallimastix californiae]|uniref:Uncharacterized protein n=1 Tax=Neocallimastix californiae TaxID=1754190 RepID=A0A1Y2FB56_9FUNG|nr:hypothetical protein LY90DRAFT_500250 [Neocallimastix californiae]|eukprot:ORY81149.1 hypothetical protein LY90DRAFT_500250 [Neocallimastix californiae]